MTFEEFCGGALWDSALAWHPEDPRLTYCFQRVFLQWVPCCFLVVFLGYEVHKIRRSRYRDIPWNWLNVSKMIVVFLLVCDSGVDLGLAVMSKDNLPTVEPVTKALNAASYVSFRTNGAYVEHQE